MRFIMPRLLHISIAAGALILGGCLDEFDSGCDSDNDCKGDRICQYGECVDASVGGSGGSGGFVASPLTCGAIDIPCNCGTLGPNIGEGSVASTSKCASGQHEFQSCSYSCGAGVAWRTVCHCEQNTGGAGGGGGGPATCPTRSGNIAPSNPPPYSCGQPGTTVDTIMQQLNEFWESGIQACVRGPDLPQCVGNAWAISPQDGGMGYIYFDPTFLEVYSSQAGTLLMAANILAHEVGHNIQNAFGSSSLMISKELGADCYAGYFIGWLICNGEVNGADLMGTFAGACQGGDGSGFPWFDVNTHGTCTQRVQAIQLGIQRYSDGVPPVNACTF